MEPVKISSLELENVKRLRAVQIVPSQDGLTVIGGRNAQGKSSVLDAIAWALGGNKLKPSNPNRDGGATPAKLHVELSNGIVVERKGKNGSLYVRDSFGGKGTQKLLDEFLSVLALDLRKFMAGSDKDKADALLQTLGIDHELRVLDGQIQVTFDDRRDAARLAKRNRAHADSLPHYDDAPEEPVSVTELIQQQQAILARNGENQRKREQVSRIKLEMENANREVNRIDAQIGDLEGRIEELRLEQAHKMEERDRLLEDLITAKKTVEQLQDESTAEIEASIADIENINEKVNHNRQWRIAEDDAETSEATAKELDAKLEELRAQRVALLDGAPLPLEGLAVDTDGRMTYHGQVWSDMSSAEQLRVATAIVQATKPECGFVLVDELEKFDSQQLAEFGAWAMERGLQVIGTRVGTDDACTIIIEDGKVEGQDLDDPVAPDPRGKALEFEPEPAKPATPTWGGASF
jgi:DNA repair exonuclease SbcCD ATPase subunit